MNAYLPFSMNMPKRVLFSALDQVTLILVLTLMVGSGGRGHLDDNIDQGGRLSNLPVQTDSCVRRWNRSQVDDQVPHRTEATPKIHLSTS
jgi:hypothetical protein